MTFPPYTCTRKGEVRQLEEWSKTLPTGPLSEEMNRIEAVRRHAAWRSLDPPGYKLESRKHVNDEFKSITHKQYSSRAGTQVRTVYREWAEGHL
jgi:hypothetical protein